MKKYQEMNDAYTHSLAVGETHKAEIGRNRLAVWAMMYNDGVGLYNKGRDTAAYFDQAIDRFYDRDRDAAGQLAPRTTCVPWLTTAKRDHECLRQVPTWRRA